MRKSIAKGDLKISNGDWGITELKVLNAVPDDSNDKLVNLAIVYAIQPVTTRDSGGGLSKEPVRYQRTITVNDGTQKVVSIGKAQRIEQVSSRPVDTINSTSAESRRLLSEWRLRTNILRRAISKVHPKIAISGASGGGGGGDGVWAIEALRVVSANHADNQGKLISLMAVYTIGNLEPGSTGLPEEPISYRQNIIVNDDTESVVSVGKAQRIK